MYKILTSNERLCILSNNYFSKGKEKIKEIIKKPKARVHFSGVGGVGMYSLFELSKSKGIDVSGSDAKNSELFQRLLLRGENVTLGHSLKNVERADALVYTLALSEDDAELAHAKKLNIPTVSRAEYMSALTEGYRFKIGVSGSHGKSTVTAMLAEIFIHAGRAPTVVCGASLSHNGSPILIGKNDYLIYEACEYKNSFLEFSPDISVFTNLELDHVDFFKNLDILKKSFVKAGNLAKSIVANTDDCNIKDILEFIKAPLVSVGTAGDCDFTASSIEPQNNGYSFKLSAPDGYERAVRLNLLGSFNVSNALLAIAAAYECGISTEASITALGSFSGIERRLQRLDGCLGMKLYYDYAHHPTEIKKGIESVKEVTTGRITVIFKPHTYSRTHGFFKEFKDALSIADKAVILDIDGIRERDTYGTSAEKLADYIGENAVYSKEQDILSHIIMDNDGAVIVMGAADQTKALEILRKEK